MNIKPILYIHPLAKVTTPYDIAYNRTMEEENGHGSVGVGIAATMKRHLETGYKLYAMDLELSYSDILEQKLTNISDYYHNLMITLRGRNTPLYENYLRHLEVLRPDLDQYKLLYNAKSLPFEVVGYDRLSYYDSLIFEGSQGIMLDMDHGIFPNVTYANTTSKNALEILKNFSCKVEVFYVTRCYQTRHGRGWMSNVNPLPLINNEEEINLTNKWQGSFRVGDLDYSLLNYAMEVDNLYSSSLRKNLVVTCLDQLPSFKFDYSKIKTRIFCHYENSSPKYGGMIKCP